MPLSPDAYATTSQQAIAEVAESFHLRAESQSGEVLTAPASFQMSGSGHPYRGGKASPDELQGALLLATSTYSPTTNAELHKLIMSYELGTDCSNFVYHCLQAVHQRAGAGEYADTVFRDTDEINYLAETKSSWVRQPGVELAMPPRSLVAAGQLSALFNKQPQFLIGSAHMTAPEAVQPVADKSVLPGDIVALQKIGRDTTVHVGVVAENEQIDADESVRQITIWHSLWMHDKAQGGVRQDTITLYPDGSYTYDWPSQAHTRLEHRFLRPNGLAAAIEQPSLLKSTQNN